MDIEKIFSDLESNQTHESEESKKKLVEWFTQTKEQWLVHTMLDYFLKTGSVRILEVLVKVQSPHDAYIFDRIDEWLKTQQYRVQALNIFCFVVRRHPTWLFKIEKHRLIKNIFKLLLNEKEIVPLMIALLCVISLLPIIPNLVPNFLNDLFDVFGHLASWKLQSSNRLPEDKLVHLQLGLQMLFHRLYGMYPCNFMAYLSDFIKKDKVGGIFQHTIKPLLETVRVHPMLVTANAEIEKSNARWKEMEPHDVEMECAQLSLPTVHQDFSYDHNLMVPMTPAGIRSTPSISRATSTTSNSEYCSYQLKDLQQNHGPIPRFDTTDANQRYIWSPYNEVNSSGPIPLTPTPSYRPLVPSSAQLLGVTGSSPPEAAVEATPETTPMKDIKELKHHATLSASSSLVNPAVRAIFVSSQPSSPMRKEQHSQFYFPDFPMAEVTTATSTSTTVVEQVVTRITTYDQRIQQVIQDRTQHSQSPFQTIETLSAKLDGLRSPTDASANADTPEVDKELSCHFQQNFRSTPTTALTAMATTTTTAAAIRTPIPISTPHEDHVTKICGDCNESDRNMCTAGGLHMPTSRSVQQIARRYKRRTRMASYCSNETSEKNNLSAVKKDGTFMYTADNVKVRRTKSCSAICTLPSSSMNSDDEDAEVQDTVADVVDMNRKPGARLQKSSKMLAIPSVSKQTLKICNTFKHTGTQTLETEPQHYENSLIEMLFERKKMRNSYENNMLSPQEILDQFISKDNIDSCSVLSEQYQLLCLQLQYERYRRSIHAERNRRLMGRSRDKRSLEMERDRLSEQLKNFATKNEKLVQDIDKAMKSSNERDQYYLEEIAVLKSKYQNEIDQNKCLRQANENLQTRLNEELTQRKDINYELESLRGQIFNFNTELQHAQQQVDIGMQYKQELARLEAEFIVMGEVQVKCRDQLTEMENLRARDDEIQMLQETYNIELKDLKHNLEEKTSQFESARHKIIELQTQLVNSEKVITEHKRLLKTVKDEYEEMFKALNKKYDVQKIIIMQMEEKLMMSLQKPQSTFGNSTCSPDTDKTDVASSMDRNSPLSTSLASSESLSVSLRSTEMRNLQQLVETPIPEIVSSSSSGINVVSSAAVNIIEGTRIPSLDLASSANTATGTQLMAANAINIVIPSSGASAAAYNYDLVTAASTSHTHPHLHLQQQQQEQQKR